MTSFSKNDLYSLNYLKMPSQSYTSIRRHLDYTRIEIGERTEKYSRHSAQKIRIVYRDIGEWDQVADSEENTTPCSEIISESA